MLRSLLLLDKDASDPTGGSFEQKVLKGVDTLVEEQKTLKSQVQAVKDDLGRSDKIVKDALEDLTKTKNSMNESWETISKKMKKLKRAIELNARSSWKDPVERTLANEELRFWGRSTSAVGSRRTIPRGV